MASQLILTQYNLMTPSQWNWDLLFCKAQHNLQFKGLTKGSLHEKKTEIVWSFAKPGGGGVPPNQTPKRFPAFSLEKNGNCTKLR